MELTQFKKSIFAGIMINIAATIYLSISNQIIGSLMFSFGLLVISTMNYNLYTGMAGYYPLYNFGELFYVFTGNVIGCAIYSVFYEYTEHGKEIKIIAYKLCENKFSASYLSIFIMSILCGVMMFIAVNIYKNNKNIIGVIIVILCVSGFILSGFEHSIANLSYLALANYPPSLELYLKLFLMIIGNFIGSLITRLSIEKFKITK
jgi:nitrite transporter NirC